MFLNWYPQEQLRMSNCKVNYTVFLDNSDGEKRSFPDWLNKYKLTRFFKEYPGGKDSYGCSVKCMFNAFSWDCYVSETKFNQTIKCNKYTFTGTVYDCRDAVIGNNELYTFKLEKIMYQETNEYSSEMHVLMSRIMQLTEIKIEIREIESDIENMANDPSITDFSEQLKIKIERLNILLQEHPELEAELHRLKLLVHEQYKPNLMIMFINIHSKNKRVKIVPQEILVYRIAYFPICQWYDI
jgi:hypothetical protein